LAKTLAFTDASESSMLDEDVDMLFELALSTSSVESTLEDDSERLSDEVRFVAMLALTELSALSTLAEEKETLRELSFIAPSATSMLNDELERLTLEI
jgi:hypothetical protein